MAAKSTVFDTNWLKLIFQAIGIPNLADNAATAPLTSLYMSLHTASPGVGGTQTTSEAAYTGYARVPVARTTGGFTVTGASVSPAATVVFPAASAGSETETFFGVGTAATGAGSLLYFGAIAPTIAVAAGVTPQLTTATTVSES